MSIVEMTSKHKQDCFHRKLKLVWYLGYLLEPRLPLILIVMICGHMISRMSQFEFVVYVLFAFSGCTLGGRRTGACDLANDDGCRR
jgi:hypothetical protein